MPKSTQIIYLSEVIFNQHMSNAFGVNILRSRGYSVELWDISAIFHPQYNDKCKNNVHVDCFNNVRFFKELSAVVNAIKSQPDNTIFLLFMWYRIETWQIFRTLSKFRRFYGLQLQNSHPSPKLQRFSWKRTISKLTQKPSLVINKLFSFLKPSYTGIRSADFFVAGGKITATHPLISESTNIIWTSAYDYSLYLEEQKQNNRIASESDYIVFLDNYWPYHEDFILLGKPLISPEDYYPKMRDLFDLAENKTGYKVIIAAHPKSFYDDKLDLFGNRSIYKGNTLNLVKHAHMVIAHDSLSLNFAVLYNKPVLFTKFNFDPLFDGEVIPDAMAEAFGKQAINLDIPNIIDTIDFSAEMLVNQPAYVTYMENYIVTPKGLKKNSWETVADYFDSMSPVIPNIKRSFS